jgi:hypothetical protein
MPTATISYMAFGGIGEHSRRPARSAPSFGWTQFSGGPYGPPGGWPTGSTLPIYAGQLPPQQPVNGQTCYFAFATISDGTNSLTSTQADQGLSFTVGTAPVTAFIAYVPPPGGGGHGPPDPGATIDSWDETTGGLLTDPQGEGPIFVTVSPDDAAQDVTTEANNQGFVPTANTQETISALATIASPKVTFDQWVNLWQNVPSPSGQPPFPASGVNLTAAANTSYLALAFYKAVKAPPLTTCEQELANWNSVKPKPENIAILEFYRRALIKCVGPQYTAAVNEIDAIIKELEGLKEPRARK